MSDACERWAALSDRVAIGDTLRHDEHAFIEEHGASCSSCSEERAVWGELDAMLGREPVIVTVRPTHRPTYVWAVAAALFVFIVAGRAGEFATRDAHVVLSTDVHTPTDLHTVLVNASVTEAVALEIDGRPAQVGDDVPSGATLFAREGRACLRISGGVNLCATEGSSFRIAQLTAERRIELRAGRLLAELEPQPVGISFGVLTRDGAAIAIGTAFSVEVPTHGPAITRVLHGTVLVRSTAGIEARVTAQQKTAMDLPVVEPDLPDVGTLPAVPLAEPEPARVPLPVRNKPGVVRLPTAFSLLSEAREQRARGDVRGALTSYRTLIARYAESSEAQAARVPYGEIVLADGDALMALRAFEHYLTRGGALREEASFGRIRALRALGNYEGEVEALHEFLQTYPRSPLAESLRLRARELGVR